MQSQQGEGKPYHDVSLRKVKTNESNINRDISDPATHLARNTYTKQRVEDIAPIANRAVALVEY